LRTAGAEVDIGDKQGAKASSRALFAHIVTSHARAASRFP
jgi:hypothetical protein